MTTIKATTITIKSENTFITLTIDAT